MGWFLFKQSRTTKKKKTKVASNIAAVTAWDPQRTVLGLKILGGGGLVVAVVLGWVYGYQGLRNYVRHAHAARVFARDVELVHAPVWMSRAVREQLKQTVADHVSADPLDGSDLTIAALALKRVPWVRKVVQIHRLQNGIVRVQARYRAPIALIQARNGYYLTDDRGTQLLAQPYYKDQLAALGLPTITGVSCAPPAAPGARWRGRGVQAGLKLLAVLTHEPFFNQIQSVNVARRDAQHRIRLFLHTRDGGTIAWGFAPGREQAIEPSASEKVKRLAELARRFHGSIDAGGRDVQIFGAAIETRRPVMPSADRVDYTSNWR